MLADSKSHASYIAPEDVKADEKYALTLNPKEQLLDNDNQLLTHAENMNSFFHDELFPKKYRFWMERSNTGRIHYHGYVQFINFKEIDNFYKLLTILKDRYVMSYKFGHYDEILRVELGVTPHNFIPKYNTWLEYCKKQVEYWKSVEFTHYEFKPSDVVKKNKLVIQKFVNHALWIEMQKVNKKKKNFDKKDENKKMKSVKKTKYNKNRFNNMIDYCNV